MNTPLLERHLAVLQMKHYLSLQQSAMAAGDENEVNRASQQLERLVNEYGIQALREAKSDCYE
ncbi:hypothetical protein [Pseudomonas sp. R37(2017)]|uniref:hypothetical protein n=1 Tax=Pseudomonas sp. R37(2017) TaxID=1981685 RepID=UPI001179BE5B|nr:hypothetical protein [Pseudomonas sp. R37(2017)]